MASGDKIRFRQGTRADVGGTAKQAGQLLFATYEDEVLTTSGAKSLVQGDIYFDLSSGNNGVRVNLANDVDKARTLFAGETSTVDTAGQWHANIEGVTTLYDGLTIVVRLNSSYNGTFNTLNVNNLGAKLVWYRKGSRLINHVNNPGNGQEMLLVYRVNAGSYTVPSNSSRTDITAGTTVTDGWIMVTAYQDGNTYPSAYCSTAAGTAAKGATCTDYTATPNTYIHVLFTATNTANSALTLNINSQGAKPLYINGQPSSSSNKDLTKGSYLAYYDGTNYYVRTDGVLPGSIERALAADKATSLATSGTIQVKLNSTTAATYTSGGDITPGVTGTLSAGNGGTGRASLTNNATLVGNDTGSVKLIASAVGAYYVPGTSGNDAVPRFGTLPASVGGTGVTSIADIKAGKDSDGNVITSTYATKDELNNLISIADAMVFKGVVDDTHALPATHEVGWTYRVGTAGTYAGKVCEVGDIIICITDGTAADNTHWIVIQTNIDGAVTGPTSGSVQDGAIVAWNGTTGRIIKKSATKGSASLPIYLDNDGLPQTITSYQGQSNSAIFLRSRDTKNDTIDPSSLDATTGIRFDFKAKATVGLPNGASYAGVMSYRPYASASDWSGGPAHQIAFNGDSKLYHRISDGDTDWDDWEEILTSNSTLSISKLSGLLSTAYGGTGYGKAALTTNRLIRSASTGSQMIESVIATSDDGKSIYPVTNNDGTLGISANHWNQIYGHQIIVQGTTNNVMTAASKNPRITFQEGTGTQPVHLIYTDLDSYRSPAGLKIIGGSSATPAWFEVEGDLYSGGIIYAKNTTDATSTTTGAAIISGGLGVAKQLRVGEAATLSKSLSVGGATLLSSTLDVNGKTTLNGVLQIKGNSYVHTAAGTAGSAGYVKIAQLVIGGSYQNQPITIEISRRNDKTNTIISIQFQNLNGNDPNLVGFTISGVCQDVYMNKSATSTWDLYIKKSENYDTIWVNRYHKPYNSNITLTWKDELLSTAIDGWQQATHTFGNLSWTAGTTSGPVLNLTIDGQTLTATIPSAANEASGIVTTGDQQFDGNKTFKGSIYPQEDSKYTLGSPTLNWNNIYANNLMLNRKNQTSSVKKGMIKFYDSVQKTWTIYMNTNTVSGAPNGAAVAALGNVTSPWTLRSYIENTEGYGWIWESSAESSTASPTPRMALSASNGNLTLTGDMFLSSGNGETDRSLVFSYKNDTTLTNNNGASWRIAHLASGSGDTNYLAIQSTTSTTGSNKTWNNVMRFGMNSYDAYLAGNINPFVNATQTVTNNVVTASTTAKSLGINTQRWNDIYVLNVRTTQLKALDDNTFWMADSSNNQTVKFITTKDSMQISPYADLKGSLGNPNNRWNSIYVGSFNPDYTLTKTIKFDTDIEEWKDLGISGEDLAWNGTYIIQIYDNTTTGALLHYQTYWSGMFSWYRDGVNGSGQYSEIPLHGAGHALNSNQIFLRTIISNATSGTNTSRMKLQIKTNKVNNATVASSLTIKIKHIM